MTRLDASGRAVPFIAGSNAEIAHGGLNFLIAAVPR